LRLEITKSKQTPNSIQQLLEQFSDVITRQAERIELLSQSLESLQNEHRQLEALASQMLAQVEKPAADTEQADGDKAKAAPPEATASPKIPAAVISEAIPTGPGGPQVQAEQALTASPATTAPPEETAARAEVVDIPHQKEEEEKVLRDARRFSKLLISEIELYNKNSLEEGRRNKDIYQRLKKDIDRSRETYEKRFAHTAAKQSDYFYEELVKTLAKNDPLLLGFGYPGPSV
jgi:hypothetical protein